MAIIIESLRDLVKTRSFLIPPESCDQNRPQSANAPGLSTIYETPIDRQYAPSVLFLRCAYAGLFTSPSRLTTVLSVRKYPKSPAFHDPTTAPAGMVSRS